MIPTRLELFVYIMIIYCLNNFNSFIHAILSLTFIHPYRKHNNMQFAASNCAFFPYHILLWWKKKFLNGSEVSKYEDFLDLCLHCICRYYDRILCDICNQAATFEEFIKIYVWIDDLIDQRWINWVLFGIRKFYLESSVFMIHSKGYCVNIEAYWI